MGPFPLKRLLRSTYTLTFSHSRTFFLHHALASPIVPSSEGAPGANQGGQPSAPPVVDGADISTGATDASAEAREARRKRIEARTGTVDDYRAEIAVQERELTAAVKEKGKVDDEIETAKAEIATREAKHPSVIMVELKDELARLATSIQLETDKQTVYLNQTQMSTTHIAAMRADIETLKSERQALEQQMGK